MPYISLHASQHLITANYQQLSCVIWCVFFLWAIPSNYAYIISSSESLLQKGSPVALLPLDRGKNGPYPPGPVFFRPGRYSHPGRTGLVQTSPSLAVDWHMGHALPARPLSRLRGESDHGAANPTTLFRNHFNPHLKESSGNDERKNAARENSFRPIFLSLLCPFMVKIKKKE